MLHIFFHKILANGNGYELLQDSVDYRISSSARKNPPTYIKDSQARSIHVELYTDLFESERFLEVSLSAQIVLSGLRIDTKRSMALQEFSIHYARRHIQYPGEMETLLVRNFVLFIQYYYYYHLESRLTS